MWMEDYIEQILMLAKLITITKEEVTKNLNLTEIQAERILQYMVAHDLLQKDWKGKQTGYKASAQVGLT